jgi:hypothetical protein
MVSAGSDAGSLESAALPNWMVLRLQVAIVKHTVTLLHIPDVVIIAPSTKISARAALPFFEIKQLRWVVDQDSPAGVFIG